MTDRPTIRVLICRGDWTADTPEAQIRRASWLVIDLLAVPVWLRLGYRPVALDPISESAWYQWRANNPEAA